jgi:hypothetical protein
MVENANPHVVSETEFRRHEEGILSRLSHVIVDIGHRMESKLMGAISCTERERPRGYQEEEDFKEQMRLHRAWPELPNCEHLSVDVQCSAVTGSGRVVPGHLMVTDRNMLFSSTQDTMMQQLHQEGATKESNFKVKLPLIDIVSMQRVIVNGHPAMQVFASNGDLLQLQQFTGTCSQMHKSIAPFRFNSLFEHVFAEIDYQWRENTTVPREDVEFLPPLYYSQ